MQTSTLEGLAKDPEKKDDISPGLFIIFSYKNNIFTNFLSGGKQSDVISDYLRKNNNM
jgi:hypothetical protein